MDKLMFYLLNDDNDGIICGIPSMIPTKVTDGMPPPSQIPQPFEAKVGKTRMIGDKCKRNTLCLFTNHWRIFADPN